MAGQCVAQGGIADVVILDGGQCAAALPHIARGGAGDLEGRADADLRIGRARWAISVCSDPVPERFPGLTGHRRLEIRGGSTREAQDFLRSELGWCVNRRQGRPPPKRDHQFRNSCHSLVLMSNGPSQTAEESGKSHSLVNIMNLHVE
jgi:hypothetical protein